MSQLPYIFNQLLSYIPKDMFDRLVKKYDGNKFIKDYTCWNHLLVMVWAQLTSRRSLRDIESSIRAHYDKTYRMGIGRTVSRNNIAYANARRNVAIYRELAQQMMLRTSKINVKEDTLKMIGDAFSLTGFFAIDSSTISFNLDRYPWSVPQKEWGGIKLHTMFDLLRCSPRMCMITGHEERDQTFMDDYPYEMNCMYMFDKMYFKTTSLYHIHSCQSYFVTRIKDNVRYKVIDDRPTDGVHAIKDVSIQFTSRWASKGYPEPLRLIFFYSEEKNAVIKFITNNFELEAATIALLYRYRWQIELFFKWIKQHLRITAFFGTSGNAVMTQVYIGYITFCCLALAADDIGFKGSLYDFSNIMSVTLTERILMKDLMIRYNKEEARREEQTIPSLFDFDNLTDNT